MDARGSDGAARVRSIRYRYRTSVLLGRWKSSPREAALDAIRSGQAELDDTAKHGIRWRVDGEIEEEDSVR